MAWRSLREQSASPRALPTRNGRPHARLRKGPEHPPPDQHHPSQHRDPGGRSDPGREAGTEPGAAPAGTAQPAEPAAGTRAGLATRPGASRRGLPRSGAGPARTSEAVCQAQIHPLQVAGKQRRVSPPSARRPRTPAAAAPRRNYAIRTQPGLSRPAGSSGNHAGKVAGHQSRRLPSLTHLEEESATRLP